MTTAAICCPFKHNNKKEQEIINTFGNKFSAKHPI